MDLDGTLPHKKLSFSAAVAEEVAIAPIAAATMLHTNKAGAGVQVYLRLRPLNDAERRSSERKVVDIVDATTVRFDAPEVGLMVKLELWGR